MSELDTQSRFEELVLPHLDAAYNLARWLSRNPDDAHDVVQEALVKALKYISSYRGGNSRSWFLVIVRNSCYSWLQRNRSKTTVPLEDETLNQLPSSETDSETNLMRGAQRDRVRQAVQDLPIEFREVIILRELEGMSYKEISDVAGIPVGTVMSRLARGRSRLQEILSELRSNP